MHCGKGLLPGNYGHHVLVALVIACLAAVATGQDASQAPSSTPPPQAATPDQTPAPEAPPPSAPDKGQSPDKSSSPDLSSSLLQLGTGDLVEVSVYGIPELATKTRINNAGDLYLPLVDYVHVAGLGVEEAQRIVERRLEDGGFVRNPHVTIFVDESASQGASLIGEVAHPGIYPVLGERRLFDVITAAGGLSERAGRTVVITHRDDPDNPVTLELGRNLTDKPESNVVIRPGDSVDIHRASMVYIVGDIARPSGLAIDNGSVTVLQAVALAGGPLRTAKLNSTRILRKVGVDGVSETKVPLKKMLEAKAPDMPLEPNDIVVIPVSGGKVLAASSFQAAMAISTALAIYTIHP